MAAVQREREVSMRLEEGPQQLWEVVIDGAAQLGFCCWQRGLGRHSEKVWKGG